MGKVSHAAAQLRGAVNAYSGNNPMATNAIPAGFLEGHRDCGNDVQDLRSRMEAMEGTNRILRAKLDQLERDRQGLRQRLHQMEGRTGTHQATATVKEMQRQLHQLKEQLMFKEQEVEEIKRKQASNRVGVGHTGEVGAVTGPAPVSEPRTSQHAVHAVPAAAGKTLPAESPVEQQQQQQHLSERSKRRAHGSAIQQSQIACSAEPLIPEALTLTLDDTPSAAVSRLWAACPAAMGVLLAAARHHGGSCSPSVSDHAGPAFASLLDPRRRSYGAEEGGVHDAEIIAHAAIFADSLPRIASGMDRAKDLLPTLCALVLRACEMMSSERNQVTCRTEAVSMRAEHAPSVAASALTVMGHLVRQDAGCRRHALMSLGVNNTSQSFALPNGPPRVPSSRIEFTQPELVVVHAFNEQALLSVASSEVAVHRENSNNNNNATAAAPPPPPPGVLDVCVQASISMGKVYEDVASGALGLAVALAGATRVGAGRVALLPLLTSRAMESFFGRSGSGGGSGKSLLELRALHLLHLLVEDPAIVAAMSEAISALWLPTGAHTPAAAANDRQRRHQRRRSSSSKTEANDPTAASCEPASKKDANQEVLDDVVMVLPENVHTNTNENGEVISQPFQNMWWAGAALDALMSCLSLRSAPDAAGNDTSMRDAGEDDQGRSLHTNGGACKDDEGAIARAAMATISLLLEQHADVCLRHMIERDTFFASQGAVTSPPKHPSSGGKRASDPAVVHPRRLQSTTPADSTVIATSRNSSSIGFIHGGVVSSSLPVRLVFLAEQVVTPLPLSGGGSDGGAGLVLSTIGWPKGQWTSERTAQCSWQMKLRVAQEALTLLRGLMLSPTLGIGVVNELTPAPGVTQRNLSALARLSRIESTPEEENQVFFGVPVAAWAYAIGTSSAAGSLCSPEVMALRGFPCCSGKDVVHLARGATQRIKRRVSP